MKLEIGIEHTRSFNMLCVPHFSHKIINTFCVCQLMALVHEGYLWLGWPIPIDNIMVHIITVLPYQGMNPIDAFVGKS